MHMGLLETKRALILGVTNRKSIGWGIAKALSAQGARIVLGCVEGNLRRVTRLAPEVGALDVIPCDVRKDSEITALLTRTERHFPEGLDILVHSVAWARMEDLGGEFIRIARDGWRQSLEVSAYSLVALAREARPLMRKAGGGSIITLTFAGGNKVVPGYNIMGIAKAALDICVRYLAYDLGPENIRVNAISAAPLPTPSSIVIEDFEKGLRLMAERSPMVRNITLEEVGGTAVYLASSLSSALTGQIIKVDCGMHTMAPPTPVHRNARNPGATP